MAAIFPCFLYLLPLLTAVAVAAAAFECRLSAVGCITSTTMAFRQRRQRWRFDDGAFSLLFVPVPPRIAFAFDLFDFRFGDFRLRLPTTPEDGIEMAMGKFHVVFVLLPQTFSFHCSANFCVRRIPTASYVVFSTAVHLQY